MIKENKREGIEMQTKLSPLELRVNSNDYYVHPGLAEDFEDLKTVILNIDDFGNEMGARNYLFSGPPGTGKTLGAMVLASELEVPFYDITAFVKSGQTEVVFQELRKCLLRDKKLIAFIDEIDGMSSRGEIVDPMQYQAFTQFLSQLDGVDDNNGIFLLMTSNRPNGLDEALRSRIAEEIEFMPPDKDGRYKILQIHVDNKEHNFKVNDKDLEELAKVTFGYVGRDLKQVLNRAFTKAKRDNRTDVEYKDLEYGLKKTKPSAIRDMPFVEPAIKFEGLAGYEIHKALLKSIVERSNGSVILSYGPKGCGKTAFAEALAGEYGYNFILLKGSELESKWVGDSKDRVEKVLKRAKQLSPCILCFDEISSFVERQGVLSHKDSQTGYLQSVLNRPPEGVYIIGTDNNPNFLKGPFVDRFVHKIYFPMPSELEQKALWELYAPDAVSDELVEANPNLSCRDIFHACKQARDFGQELRTDVLAKLVKGISNDVSDYENIVRHIGDSVENYRRIRGLLEE
ncbi:MAG: AAA family ATPase [Nanoarchaeota archaeon]|nr:AAA family ATPase [Nanoarchaeota archaeon]MBU4456980.1 AAA family ATPase [Nanoarchaeota archaeon]